MTKKLVIVESPAKAKTIAHYLGEDYTVLASVGHVRDLPSRQLGVDVEHEFEPSYVISKGKDKVVSQIRKAAANSPIIYLATDLDREGEAIAWHVAQAAQIDLNRTRRITFDQVTKSAILKAVAQPRALDMNLIDAQQARRVLDRLVGYKISPLLAKSMQKRLSAGRVQSIALRLVVEREREILAFIPVEYWTIEADLERKTRAREQFRARLHQIAGNKAEIGSQQEAEHVLKALQGATYCVTAIRNGKRLKNPEPPFITSTLQAEASRKLGLSPRQTMRLAQQLYEGIDLDGERVGLITYMRTDSTHVAPEAQQEARELVAQRWGPDYLPNKAPVYTKKIASAQEAHEAIRPTSALRTPELIAARLDRDQARLYELIWQRFVASQMKPALYDTQSIDITAAQDYLFRATGATLVFPGYMLAYTEGRDDDTEEESSILPPLKEGELLTLLELLPEQHFTQPPPRYNEPTLIKAMEENGVGRPSTYASIVSIIQDRGYVNKDHKRLYPTALGIVVCDVLVETFPDIMDIKYTAGMEGQLDSLAQGKVRYEQMLRSFYDGFAPQVNAAKDKLPLAIERALSADLPDNMRQRTCPDCGAPLQARLGREGRFLGCSGYPQCRYTLDLAHPDASNERRDTYAEGELCEKCGGRMKIVERATSTFLGCENYPECKNTRPILSEKIRQLAQTTPCPQCAETCLEPRKGRYGEYLYCPTCKLNHSLYKLGLVQGKGQSQTSAARESAELPCPLCGKSPIEKRSGRYGPYYHCPHCKKNTSEKKMPREEETNHERTPNQAQES